jgi:hypothetical protein
VAARERGQHAVVDTHVQDRLEHAGHRGLPAAAHRKQQRPWPATERAPRARLELGEAAEHVGPDEVDQRGGIPSAFVAPFAGHAERGRYRQPHRHHGRDRAPLAADEDALGTEVGVECHRNVPVHCVRAAATCAESHRHTP